MAIGDSTMLNPFLTQSFSANGQLPPNYQEARDAFQRQLDAQNAQGLGSPRAAVIGNDQFGQPFGYASDANAFNQFYNQNYGNAQSQPFQAPPGTAIGIASPGGAGGVGTTTYLDNFGNRIDSFGNRIPMAQPPSPTLGSGGLSGATPNNAFANVPPPPSFLPSEPITPGAPAAGASQIDATIRPFLTEGLRQAQELFLRQQPSMFPGQTYVSPSEQTLQSLQAQEDIARQASPILGQAQQAYTSSLGQVGQTAAGAPGVIGSLGKNPGGGGTLEKGLLGDIGIFPDNPPGKFTGIPENGEFGIFGFCILFPKLSRYVVVPTPPAPPGLAIPTAGVP